MRNSYKARHEAGSELGRDKVIFETDSTKVDEVLWFGSSVDYSSHDQWVRFCMEELSKHKDW